MFSHLTFQMGLIIYMGLLLLAPKVPILWFDPPDNDFLSWAHSYAVFHNQSNCWVCGVLPSLSVEGFPCSGSHFSWPETHWDWILHLCCFAPNGTYWICGSYLWAWLPPGWIGGCSLGLHFIHGFMLPELPERPANLPNLKTCWARSVFHWYDYLAAIFIPSLGTTDVMLWVDALTNFTKQSLQDSEKVISALNAEKIQIRKVVLQTDWP